MENNNTLPEDIESAIDKEAKARRDGMLGDRVRAYCFGYESGYYAGATEWAVWKVKFEELEDKCDSKIHTERNRMQSIVSEMDARHFALKEKADKMAEALEAIVSPIAYLQKEAERAGAKIDGGGAVLISKDPAFLQGLAKRALATWKEQKEVNNE